MNKVRKRKEKDEVKKVEDYWREWRKARKKDEDRNKNGERKKDKEINTKASLPKD